MIVKRNSRSNRGWLTAATLVLVVIAGSAAVRSARAQEVGAANPAHLVSRTAAYYLSPDDSLSISVANFPNLTCQALVQPDGTITVPLLGSVAVAGNTTADVAKALKKGWDKYVVDPSVTVALAQKRPINGVTIYGFTSHTGNVAYRPTLRLTQALAEMGGVSPQGDSAHLTLMRQSGDKLSLDASHLETLAGTDRDLLLEEGDVIYVPQLRAQVSVLGEVNRPGSLDHQEKMTVLDALTQSGGVKETADLGTATLLHDGKESKLNLEALLRRGDMSANTTLTPGDRIMVPEIKNRTYIFGAVGHPGYYAFKPGDRLLDALNNASPNSTANLFNINLIRVDKTKNTAQVQQVDLDKFLKKGDLSGNVPLQPGDVVFIAERGKKFSVQDLFGMASGLSLIDSTVRILNGGLGR